jgi:aryl-alcohol dehydrogenase-like predicted oxidoreductase
MLRRDIEREVVPYCRHAHIGLVPYFPLAGGLLTGKYKRGDAVSPTRSGYIAPFLTERNFQILDQLCDFAQARRHTAGELAMAWLLAEPAVVSVISGVTNPDQVSANARAAEWQFSAQDRAAVNEILEK